ncbi:MAG: hypothetical protein HY959_03380 [Ignavibacteriae bacterium]|nr:hypothetical protein [Ignavibacteriota bacterium]
MKKSVIKYFIFITFSALMILSGCVATPYRKPPVETEEEQEEVQIDLEDLGIPDSVNYLPNLTEADNKLSNGDLIFKYAFREQKKSMYAKNSDYVYLYWLKNKKLELKNHTKCNIFAINTLFKAGFKTPKTNARTKDLVNERLFKDELPIADVRKPEDLRKGDLIIWNGHVIIYDTLAKVNRDLYAKAIWAGTSKKDNGKNVLNNVIYGKYPLSGSFIVRRPVRKNF